MYNFKQVVYFFYTTVGRFICFTVLCKLFKQWSNSVKLLDSKIALFIISILTLSVFPNFTQDKFGLNIYSVSSSAVDNMQVTQHWLTFYFLKMAKMST